MFAFFTWLADSAVYDLLQLERGSGIAEALHFFVEDTTKIFALVVVMIYAIALARASLRLDWVRDQLQRRHRLIGYVLGAVFGSITPFCSCSSIPLFLGFTSARIPVGVTMSFLFTSPIINEVAVVLLASLLGWKIAVAYVLIGLVVGISAGATLDVLGAERWLKPFLRDLPESPAQITGQASTSMTLTERHVFAKAELLDILGRIWKWIFIGVGAGAALHGFVPAAWLTSSLGDGEWWTVPLSVLLGVPLYSNASGVIPVMETLLTKGVPIGTTMAFCMSTVAASFPEFILLKQVMETRLLALIFAMLVTAFTLVGWLLNAVGMGLM